MLRSRSRLRRSRARKPLQFGLEVLEDRRVMAAGDLVISEFLASNDSGLVDGDGRSSDWIEIFNADSTPINLRDYYLTDADDNLRRWNFPDRTIAVGEYLVVFASAPTDLSGQVIDDYVDPSGYPHTNFQLDRNGGYLALIYDDPVTHAVTVVHEYSPEYPEQRTDISYGIGQNLTPLVDGMSTARYLVPQDGALGQSWTQSGFDDSSWLGDREFPAATVAITEIDLGAEWVELQNVSGAAINTSGWRMGFNNPSGGSINSVYSFVYNWSDPLTDGAIRTSNENQNGIGELNWSTSLPGWAVILDNTGSVRDFAAWGYSAAEIATLNTFVNGQLITAADVPWSGDGVPLSAVGNGVLRKIGSSERNDKDGYVFSASGNQGQTNSGLNLPLLQGTQLVTAGVGYDADPTAGGGNNDLRNLAAGGVANQSSVAFGGVPDAAIDGNLGNFTHTAAGQNLPSSWSVDLGSTYALEEIIVHNRDSCCQSRLRDITVEVLDESDNVVYVSDLLNPENAGFSFPGGPSELTIDLLTENGGVPLFGQTIRITRTPDPDLSATNGQGNNDEADVLSLGEVEVMGRDVIGFLGTFATDVSEDLYQQNAGIYVRAPFTVTDLADVSQLLLRMQYDDGFVAYLNGVEVAARNAPGVRSYNSAATTSRADLDALIPENIDISAFIPLLVEGQNVLAIHGLNVTANDDDFLLVPELLAVGDTAAVRFFESPSPGAPNGSGFVDFVADTTFSHDRGFYDAPFDLVISSNTPNARVYYTTNGEIPSVANGTLYTQPIVIDHTTTLRAIAVRDGYYPTNVDTQTYLFVHDIVSQSRTTTLDAGFPSSWGGFSADYGMDPDVIGNFSAAGQALGGDRFGGVYAATIQDDLQAIPTLSIVLDVDDMFGSSGIYTNATSSGSAWERPTSVELIYPDGSTGFQIDAGIRMQGGAFRSDGLSKKHSMRLLFKGEYGATKLVFPWFGEGAVDEFDTITLRMDANDGYAWGAAGTQPQYARDEFGRRTQLAMGQPASHGTRVHLYINGVYWGLYNPVERPDASFAASYYGGDKDEWDAYNSGSAINGTTAAWNTLVSLSRNVANATTESARTAAYLRVQGLNPDGTNDPNQESYVDVVNYIDYLIVNDYGGNSDWPFKNWYAARRRGPESQGFVFHVWDYEWVLGLRSSVTTNTVNDTRGVAEPYGNLRSSLEFRMLFADRVHRALFNDGPLTAENAIARYQGILSELPEALVAESARWGDMHASTPYTVADWEGESAKVINNFLTGRTAQFLNQLKSAGLYPSIVAPSFTQHGGQVPIGYDLGVTAPAGTIYYTLDGSDPRLLGGSINPTALVYNGTIDISQGTNVRARAFSGGQWSAVNEATFTIAAPASPLNLRITEINYHPHAPNPVPGLGELGVDADEFEFIELTNISNQTIDLTGVRLVEVPVGSTNEGVAFEFGLSTLAPGASVIVVENLDAFVSRYGTGPEVAGAFAGRLGNGGERITLRAADGTNIQSFDYDDASDWPQRADGGGSSLQVVDINGDYNSAANWKASVEFGGNPGTTVTANVGDVVINEVLRPSNGGGGGWVEMFNRGATPVNVGGWYLSDLASNLFFHTLAAATIPAGGFTSISQATASLGLTTETTGQLWLVAADTAGRPLRFADDVTFTAAPAGQSLGRWLDGNPGVVLFPMTNPTQGSANSGPQLGSVVISEIHYHPSAVPAAFAGTIALNELEYIELAVESGVSQDIGGWSLQGGDLTFASGTVLGAGQTAVIVSFDPVAEPTKTAAFRSIYGIDNSVLLIGSSGGQLNNAGELIQLLRPVDKNNAALGDTLVDAVFYDDQAPWPSEADGSGDSLQRVAYDVFGPWSESWMAAPPTPGSVPFAPQLPGDFNGDFVVDEGDYSIWAQGLNDFAMGGATVSNGDGDGDGDVDGLDFLVWQQNFGIAAATPAASSSIVPTSVTRADTELAGADTSRRASRRRTLAAATNTSSVAMTNLDIVDNVMQEVGRTPRGPRSRTAVV
ncbi:MAG: lamin tail domain-containing protein [Pirellulaceae bacterium]